MERTLDRGRSRRIALLLAVLGALTLLAAGLLWRRADRAGGSAAEVRMAGLPVAGPSVAEATRALADSFAGFADARLVLGAGPRRWSFSAAELGITLDSTGSAPAASRGQGSAAPAAGELQLVLSRDRAALERALAPVAAALAVAPVDAALNISPAAIALSPSRPGEALDLAATARLIEAATATYPFAAVAAALLTVPPAVSEADLRPLAERASLLSAAPLTLRGPTTAGADGAWTLAPEQLRAMLVVTTGGTAGPGQPELSSAALNSFVAAIAAQVYVAPQPATLALPDYATVVTLAPDVPGRELDVAATVARLRAAAGESGAARAASLAFREVIAPANAATLGSLKERLDRLMNAGITLRYSGGSLQVPGEQVALTLYLEPDGDPAVPYRLVVNELDLERLVARVAGRLDVAARDARYRLVSGRVTLEREPAAGFSVDRAATAANVKAALLAGAGEAALVGSVVPAVFTDTSLSAIATPDLLQTGSSFYGYSAPERNWNVTLGAQKLDGWYVPPDGVFSLNDTLGPLTLEAGFKMGWAIQVRAGNATTIPSEAGGICQVATTLFQPLFWAGLPFVERHSHSYWIASYGKPPLGMTGLDAAIYPPYSDLKFKNSSANWLLIRAVGDGQNLKVEIRGTDPGWRVVVDQPLISNIVKTDQQTRYQTSDQLPSGRTLQVETAQDGFDVTVRRQVFSSAEQLLEEWSVKSSYLPAHNVIMNGTAEQAPAN